MKKYREYNDSGVEWIGDYPKSWRISNVGRHFNIERGRVISKIEISDCKGDYPVYSSQTTNNGELGRINTFDFDGEYVTWTTDGANTGTCFHRNGKFNTTNVCGMLSLRNIKYSLKFLNFYLNQITKPYVRVDINPKLMNNMMAEIPLLIPPLKEQEQIVAFLDDKTGKIDDLLAKIKKKIELIKENRTALINHCVTKGLNPNSPMKDSGVEWIGDIPTGWECVKLKYLCSVTTGGKDTQDKVDDGLYPFYVRSQKVERINSYSYEGESVLTAGDGVGVGKVFHYVNGKFEYHQRVYKFSDFRRVYGKFFFLFMKHHFIFVTKDQNSKSTVDSIRRPLIDSFRFSLPPLQEQQEIVAYLDVQTSKIDSTIRNEEKRIVLLKEYRQSLISNVVTGKIKVCN